MPDLVAVKAHYHNACMANFYNKRTERKRGRSACENTKNFISYLINYIVDNETECQFSVNEIKEGFSGDLPDYTTIKNKLKEHFQNDIECHLIKRDMIILYKNGTASKKLCKDWYEKRLKSKEDERTRIVEMAADIILEDIRSKVYDMNYYETLDIDEGNLFKDVPQTLQVFLNVVCKSNKEKSNNNVRRMDKKVATMSHCIITSVRPRSFLSPILLGLSSMIHKKYASKGLIDSLSNLGLCSSYKETLRFEASIIKDPANHIVSPDSYVQFVFDNADHNTCTIDGKNTFHAMGGIMVVTPASSVTSKKSISRLKQIPSSEEIGEIGFVKLKHFENKNSDGLKTVKIEDVLDVTDNYEISSADFTWTYSKFANNKSDGWNGFMEKIHTNLAYHVSKIIPVPFIKNPPSDYNTIFTSLVEAAEQCQKQEQKIVFVTFDQPLYYKAREILANIDLNNDPYNLSSIQVRLGGFHLMMSFLGAIGFIMDGSGLKEAFCEIYAENSSDKALSGHAYARAIRGHFLVQLALSEIIFSSMELSDTEKALMDTFLQDLGTENFEDNLHQDDFQIIKEKFIEHLKLVQKRGPTAKLWMQYWQMISLVKDFIRAERAGNWELHLKCVERMLPYFHASGHFLYAKSAHLYLQDMRKLKDTINDDYEFTRFTEGLFTIRRTDKFWSGVWSDMTIEQVLMRSMKTQGGLTHGRGLSESVLTKFVLTMIILVEVCNAMENFCNVSFATTEQHIDSREYRIKRDVADLQILQKFFNRYDPFPETDNIMSIFSGIIGSNSVNCHEAYEEGKKSLQAIVGMNFGSVKFKRKNKVLSLKTVQSSVKVNGDIVAIDPLLLFQRISLTIDSKKDMETYLQYELAPFPLSLFTENGLRKNVKSQLYDLFVSANGPTLSDGVVYVVDGGFLLHKVIWQKNDTVEEIMNKYLRYVEKHYAVSSYIVFDGYPEIKKSVSVTTVPAATSTKKGERSRRKTSDNIPEFDYQNHTKIPFLQENFLSNEKNKDKIIKTLMKRLQSRGFSCNQVEEDADADIIETAIKVAMSTNKTVIVVGQDIDLLVLLNQLNSCNHDIYFLKPGSGNVKDLFFTSHSFKHESLKNIVAFLHCFSGCDTTSGFAGKGKKSIVNSLLDAKNLSNLANVFYKKDASNEEIKKNGLQLIKSIYKCKNEKITLNQLRFKKYQLAKIKSSFVLANLPPTEGAAEQHCYRAYYQLQTWLGNELTATDWGWKQFQRGIMPKFTQKELIPEILLKTICCSCETGCNSLKCGCRKHGLKCTNLCSNCQGSENCSNIEEETYAEVDDSEEIVDEEPTQSGNNVGEEEGDSYEDFEDLLESEMFDESNDEEMPAKRQKLMDK